MQRGFVTLTSTGQRYAITATTMIGRAPTSDIVVNDRAASRRHLEIFQQDGGFAWRDLGSANGTCVNGQRTLGGELSDGDVISIGETKLAFELKEEEDGSAEPPSAGPPLSSEGESPDAAAADLAEGDETARLRAESDAPVKIPVKGDGNLFQEAILDADADTDAAPAESKTAAMLEALYTVVNDISSNYEPCSLIDRILETTVRAIDAQRGALFLAGADNELLPCPICNKVHRIRDGVLDPAEPGEIKISRTIVKRVLSGGESVLYQDTDQDQEFNTAESIMALSLRSVLCVPLRAKNAILGVLYIDTDRANQRYGREALLLAAAVGNGAGLALENAELHQEILEKQRMEQEIATAWSIQEGFLVKDWPEEDSRFDVYGDTLPAKTVGGDFYDFLQPAGDTVGVLIGDVSGKGVPASLTMAQLLAEFRIHARAMESPADVLRVLNKELVRRSRHGLFCTLCYLRINLKTGEVLCANAGHGPVLRVSADGVSAFGEASGPPLGVLDTSDWIEESVTLNVGESLLLYTDGITEARRARVEGEAPDELGDEGLLRIAAAQAGVACKDFVSAVQTAVREHCAPHPPHDDCTMIAVRYLGN